MNEPLKMVFEGFSLLVLAMCAYSFVLRRMADVVQPFRTKLARQGEKLLAKANTDIDKNQIKFYLDHAFCGWIAPLAVIIFPVSALIYVLMSFSKSGRARVFDADLRESDGGLAFLFAISIFAANPLFGLLLAAEIISFGAIVVLAIGPSALLSVVSTSLKVEVMPHSRQVHA